MRVTDEQIQAARVIDALTYLQRFEPGNLKRVGANAWQLRDHDSLRLSNGKFYWFSQGVGGASALDFLITVRGYGFIEAVQILTASSFSISTVPMPKAAVAHKPFHPPMRRSTSDNAVKYLQSRGIEVNLISPLVERGDIYESIDGCAVFVGRDADGVARYAAKRSISGSFKGEAPGSDKRFSFQVGNFSSGIIAVTESAIDALSVHQLTGNAALSLGGTSPLALEYALTHTQQISRVLLALDNDEAGRIGCERIERLLSERCSSVGVERLPPPNGCKDWNEYLSISTCDSPSRMALKYRRNR
jgi:hypothetical protein